LGGIALATFPAWVMLIGTKVGGVIFSEPNPAEPPAIDPLIALQCLLAVAVALIGVWAAHRTAKYWNVKDPQKVVVDEVSGQQLTLLFGGFWPRHSPVVRLPRDIPMIWANHPLGVSMLNSVNWKYLLLGFILFRVFDIWKPFPARQAESLPGGWGIMADDWIAGIYAALGLWIARAAGL
jgi:phosphatidylglycerophosphatase A